jgi:hypothetical protein
VVATSVVPIGKEANKVGVFGEGNPAESNVATFSRAVDSAKRRTASSFTDKGKHISIYPETSLKTTDEVF